MHIAIASGKGGTGKTTVAASLVSTWDGPVTAVDLDVEEPNLHLFLNPNITATEKAFLDIPVVDEELCTYCGACSELCQFKAISVMGDLIMTFPEMCHGCGGCMAICPEKAVTTGQRELGEVSWGTAGGAGFLMGRLRIGEAMSPPLMRIVKHKLHEQHGKRTADVIVDAPPGVSCPAMAAVMDSDAIVLVTEPTPFGLYDFKLAWEAFSPLGLPMGAVINRSGIGNDAVHLFCKEAGIPILAEIPYRRGIAEAYSRGEIIAWHSRDIADIFTNLRQSIRELAARSHAGAKEAAHA